MMSKPDFMKPSVFRHKQGRFAIIVYSNKEEVYKHDRTNLFSEISKEQENRYTKSDAEQLCRDSSMKEVHFADKIKAYGIVCNCEDIDQSINMGIKGCKCKIVDDSEKTLQELDVNFVELKRKGL